MITPVWNPLQDWTDRRFIRYVASHAREPQALWSPWQVQRLMKLSDVELPTRDLGVWVTVDPALVRVAVLRARSTLALVK